MDSHYKNTYVMFFYVKPCDRFIFLFGKFSKYAGK